MGNFGTSTLRFGRRGPPAMPTDVIGADLVRRGVAALNTLNRETRADPAARQACLFYALRHGHAGAPLENLVTAIDVRISAFERMIAVEPGLIARENVSAALESAVYEAIATEPLAEELEGSSFDPAKFAARLPQLLRRQVVRIDRTGAAKPEEGHEAFWVSATG